GAEGQRAVRRGELARIVDLAGRRRVSVVALSVPGGEPDDARAGRRRYGRGPSRFRRGAAGGGQRAYGETESNREAVRSQCALPARSRPRGRGSIRLRRHAAEDAERRVALQPYRKTGRSRSYAEGGTMTVSSTVNVLIRPMKSAPSANKALASGEACA